MREGTDVAELRDVGRKVHDVRKVVGVPEVSAGHFLAGVRQAG